MKERKKVFRNIPKKPNDSYKIKDIIVLSGEGYNIDAWEKWWLKSAFMTTPRLPMLRYQIFWA